jgi:hypothetical protein
MNRELEQIRATMLSKGYSFFEKGDYNLNLIAVRENDVFENTFSDSLYIPHKVNGKWLMPRFNFTTLAGTLGFGGEKNPLTAAQTGTGVNGVAIVLEGQYPQGLKYISGGLRYPFTEFLQQNRFFNYLRDNDKDGLVSRLTAIKQTGNFFTHWHAMSPIGVKSIQVNYTHSAWSQGCMGGDAPTWFGGIMPIVRSAVKLWGTTFTKTLIHANDFIK